MFLKKRSISEKSLCEKPAAKNEGKGKDEKLVKKMLDKQKERVYHANIKSE